jgi:hypothetical protein
MNRFDAQVLAYCLMGNHFYLVLHTRRANLSRLMRHVNGVYTQSFNRRHSLVGHLFQGRFKASMRCLFGGGRNGRTDPPPSARSMPRRALQYLEDGIPHTEMLLAPSIATRS